MTNLWNLIKANCFITRVARVAADVLSNIGMYCSLRRHSLRDRFTDRAREENLAETIEINFTPGADPVAHTAIGTFGEINDRYVKSPIGVN